MSQVHQFTSTFNGKRISYPSDTFFYIQVTKGKGGVYKTKRLIQGNLALAVTIFNSTNVANGYKKRLLMDDETLARVIT